MTEPVVRRTEDPAEALDVAGEFLRSRPVDHNVVLSILHDRVAEPESGRYWWSSEYDEVTGFVLQSPTTFKAGLTMADRWSVRALAAGVARDAPDLPGAIGEAGVVAAFAGDWAELLKVPAQPEDAQRIYRLEELVEGAMPPGRFRQADPGERALYAEWADGFTRDTGTSLPIGPTVDRRLTEGRLWVWDDGDPVSMAAVVGPVENVARIGAVYTPPPLRGRGYAAACVTSAARTVVDAGVRHCILYAQLANPTSNAIYRRIGFEPVSDVVDYRFG